MAEGVVVIEKVIAKESLTKEMIEEGNDHHVDEGYIYQLL